MKNLIEIFETLRSKGLCSSQAEFSERWLGRSGGYLAFLRSSGADCCPVSLLLLAERLQRRSEELLRPAPLLVDMATIMVLRAIHSEILETMGGS